jgi:proline-specific peptidase
MTSTLSTEGNIPFAVRNDVFDTWYKVVGDLASTNQRPVIILHGGPGLVHNGLLSMSDLAHRGRAVVFYDQIGNGKSSWAADKPDEFWTIDLMIDELENLLRHFKVEHNFDLVGHSWGGILASEFWLRRQPPGLKHLVLTNSMASMEAFEKSSAQIATTLPDWVREGMSIPQSKHDPRYRAAFVEFFAKHGCRLVPQPPEFWYSCDVALANTRVHDAMWYFPSSIILDLQLMMCRLGNAKTAIYATGLSRIASTRSVCPPWSLMESMTPVRISLSSPSSSTSLASSGCASRTAATRRFGKSASVLWSSWVISWTIRELP